MSAAVPTFGNFERDAVLEYVCTDGRRERVAITQSNGMITMTVLHAAFTGSRLEDLLRRVARLVGNIVERDPRRADLYVAYYQHVDAYSRRIHEIYVGTEYHAHGRALAGKHLCFDNNTFGSLASRTDTLYDDMKKYGEYHPPSMLTLNLNKPVSAGNVEAIQTLASAFLKTCAHI